MIRTLAEFQNHAPTDDGRPTKKLRTTDADTQRLAGRTLDVPARIQWRKDHGYCGETATQAIALTHGAWLSQYAVRKAAGGELLIGTETFDKALGHFTFEHWDWDFENADDPQYEDFIVWMKKNIYEGYPVIFGIYVTDGFNDADYDHIVTAVGYESSSSDPSQYDPDDVLIYHGNYTVEPIRRRVGSLAGTRATCCHDSDEGGCIPQDVCYGIAVKGLKRPHHAASTPVRLLIEEVSEPYVAQDGSGEAVDLSAQVECSGLEPGEDYVLVRYNNAEEFVTGDVSVVVKAFTAKDYQQVVEDPTPIKSTSVAFYQCARLKDVSS